MKNDEGYFGVVAQFLGQAGLMFCKENKAQGECLELIPKKEKTCTVSRKTIIS